MLALQNFIHYLEEGGGRRWLRGLVATLAFLGLATLHNRPGHYEPFHPEAMDAAQVAHHLAEGKGFSTDYLRPLSFYLLEHKSGQTNAVVTTPAPDLAQAPLYPALLAGYMQMTPFDFSPPASASDGRFAPERSISWLNQGLFFLLLVSTFRLARRLFDEPVAWLAVLTLGGTELLWQFTSSGLPLILAMLLTVWLVQLLTLAERGAREGGWGTGRLVCAAFSSGLLVGALGLTQYGFLALAVPVVAFWVLAFAQRRAALVLAMVAGLALVTTPWLVRNQALSGTNFGVAGYAMYEDTPRFPADRLQRSFSPYDPATPADLGKYELSEHQGKLVHNLAALLTENVFGVTWLSGFFLVSLFLGYQNPALSRLRWWIIASLGVLFLIQSLGRTHLSATDPVVTGENRLAILLPLAAVFGAGLLVILLDQFFEPMAPGRHLVVAAYVLLLSLPLVISLISHPETSKVTCKTSPLSLYKSRDWLKTDEITLTDQPWLMAWYGQRPAVALPLDAGPELVKLQAHCSPVMVFLTPDFLESALPSLATGRAAGSWEALSTDLLVKQEVPDGFRWRQAFVDWFPQYLILADRPRWAVK